MDTAVLHSVCDPVWKLEKINLKKSLFEGGGEGRGGGGMTVGAAILCPASLYQ